MLVSYIRAAHKSDEGATAVEYSLLAALIAGGLILAVTNLRKDIEALITTLMAAI
ncbi:Flp/Fap pilin component [Actinoplanes lutulentus]|uniref:Flp/Fap pilin component n=2 Tax=Actinoplanes lutulentus TaxID=1287878 RepID=A0A327ZBQ6_9ACTN|nr:Flp/Fap pilin component [Actinoplanes lutulentus]